DRLARLHQQRLVVLEPVERGDHAVERRPVACRLAAAAVDDQLFRLLGHLRVEGVHQHPLGRFLDPALRRPCRAAARAHDPGMVTRVHDAPIGVNRPSSSHDEAMTTWLYAEPWRLACHVKERCFCPWSGLGSSGPAWLSLPAASAAPRPTTRSRSTWTRSATS